MKVVAVAFASKLHRANYVIRVYEAFKKALEGEGVEVYPDVLDEDAKLTEALAACEDSIPVILVLTGGVSDLARRFVEALRYNSAILVAHTEHNSLPSAISIRSKLESRSISTYVFTCKDPLSPADCVKMPLSIAKSAASVVRSTIGTIGHPIKEPIELRYEDKFDARVLTLSYDELVEAEGGVEEVHVRGFLEKIKAAGMHLHDDALTRVGRIYGALKKIAIENKLNAIAVDCFNYLAKYKLAPCLALSVLNSEGYVVACERDIRSAILMMIYRTLTGYTGFIANANAFEGEYGYFSHCTVALNLIKDAKIVTHFESEHPYSLTGSFPEGTVTISSIDPELESLAVAKGLVVESGMLSNSMCRTQLKVKFDFDAEELPQYMLANHHVIVPGDLTKELKAVSSVLRMKFVDYKKLVGA